ncbi:MAG: histidine kinase [Proteobacteria bacterium]|nr:histidine kinase [Pseudomonadota bacterium]
MKTTLMHKNLTKTSTIFAFVAFIVFSILLINNYIVSSSIIILLLLIYFIFRNYRNSNVNGSTEKSAQSTDTNPDSQQYSISLDIAFKALTQLVEDPESTEPFILFLNEIEKLTDATSSAIFITPTPASQLTLLLCTDLDDQDWFKAVPFEILPKVASFETTDKIMDIFEETVQAEYKFICVRLHQDSQDLSLLVLKLESNMEISDSKTLTLLEHSNRLADIVSSARLAQLKLRHAQYEERAVIARELHDSLAQSLSYLKIQISRLQSILTGSDIQAYSKSMEIDAMMQDLRSNLNIAYRHLRELISTFRLTIGGKNFSQALMDSVEEFAKRSGIAFDIDNRLPANILTVTEETQLLHIIRESLSNVVRHSQAKFTLLSIHYDKSGQITTVIEDDGIGLPEVSNPEQHFGIIIMQERAHSIGGNISLSERVNGGACLKIVFQASKHIYP